MNENRLKKLPRSKTIARWFSEGKYCDYPAEIVCSAVNCHDFQYDSITIPIELSFYQILSANFKAFVYLYYNNTEKNIKTFLSSPNDCFKEIGIVLPVPFDENSPKILISLLEDDVYPLMQSETGHSDIIKMYCNHDDENWFHRHKERYAEWYLSDISMYGLQGVPYFFSRDLVEEYGFPRQFVDTLNFLLSHLTEKQKP